MNNFIKIKNLFFNYGEKKVLEGLKAEFSNADIIGICGANGCGKTTLLKIISGIIKGYEGEIEIFDKNIKDYKKKELAKFISFVPGEVNTPFDFSATDILLMGRLPCLNFLDSYSKADFNKIFEISDKIGIRKILDRNFNNLSNGERQLVLVAQAIIQGSSVILMDEPTSHLDIKHKIKIFDILKNEVFSRKIKVITVLHDLKLAADYCDEIYFMNYGKFDFKLKPSELSTNCDKISKIYSISEDKIKKYIL